MQALQKLDSWRSCLTLTVSTYQQTRDVVDRDPDLIARLRGAAVATGAKLAFGVGSGDARLRRIGILKCLGYLAQYSALLEMAYELKVLSAETVKGLDALRGRAHFYALRFLESTLGSGPSPKA